MPRHIFCQSLNCFFNCIGNEKLYNNVQISRFYPKCPDLRLTPPLMDVVQAEAAEYEAG